MTVYKLRNGLSIDIAWETPTIFTPRPAKPVFVEQRLYDGYLDAQPYPMDDHGNTIPQTNVVKMKVTGKLAGAAPDVFGKCALRFIQLIRVHNFSVSYFGKREDEGAVNWSWAGQLLARNIDSWVSEDDARDSAPFQFNEMQFDRSAPDTLVGRLSDTPGAQIPLANLNRATKRDNYLWSFTDRRSFESIATFVHPDGSLEVLESWKWGFVRRVALRWVKLKPEIDGTNQINFTKDVAAASVFGKDAGYADTLKSGRVANRLTRKAMRHITTDSNIDYAEVESTNIRPPERFWAP